MKKLFSLLLVAAMLLTTSILVVPTSASNANEKTVYISNAGNDANAGTAEAPVATLLKAYQLLGVEGGKIVVNGDLTVSGEYRALCDDATLNNLIGHVTITSENNATLTIAEQGIWFPGATTIENIKIHCAYAAFNSYLIANCHDFVIGEGVTVTKADTAYGFPIIYGSGMYSFLWIQEGASSNVTVKSGTWAEVYGGGAANGRGWGTHIDDVPGNVSVSILGGTIDKVYGGSNGGVGGTDPVAIMGNVAVTVSGGTINEVIANSATANTVIKGNATVTVSGGTVTAIKVNDFGEGNDCVDGTTKLFCAEAYNALASGFQSVAALPTVKTVYISDAGDDANAGTKAAPVATLLKAYQLLGAEGGVISIVGEVTIVKDPDENADYRALCKDASLMNVIEKVTITSEDGNGKLVVKSSGIWLPGATEFTNMVIYADYAAYNIYIVGNCHQLVIGENVTVEKADNAPGWPIIYGGGMYSVMGWFGEKNTSTDVVIKSGTWAKVFAGGCTYHSDWGLVDDVKGNASVTVEGGVIAEVYGGGAGGGNGILTIKGDVTVNVSGGTIDKVVANNETNGAIIEGKATVNITGGTIGEIVVNDFGGDNKVTGTILLNCSDEYRALAKNFPEIDPETGLEVVPTPPAEEDTSEDTSEASKEPVSTAAPADTNAPSEEVTTEEEATTSTTSGDNEKGCGSVIGGSLAIILAVAGAGVLVARKKED